MELDIKIIQISEGNTEILWFEHCMEPMWETAVMVVGCFFKLHSRGTGLETEDHHFIMLQNILQWNKDRRLMLKFCNLIKVSLGLTPSEVLGQIVTYRETDMCYWVTYLWGEKYMGKYVHNCWEICAYVWGSPHKSLLYSLYTPQAYSLWGICAKVWVVPPVTIKKCQNK